MITTVGHKTKHTPRIEAKIQAGRSVVVCGVPDAFVERLKEKRAAKHKMEMSHTDILVHPAQVMRLL
jgi:hypothetical protein